METVYRVIPIVLAIITFFIAGYIWFSHFEERRSSAGRWAIRLRRLILVLLVVLPLAVWGISEALLGSLVLPATVYFDNGHDTLFEIMIDGEVEGQVAALAVTQLEVSRGDHTIDVVRDGQVFESLEVTCKGNQEYVYNIGGRYTYYIVTHVYSLSGVSWRDDEPRLVGSETFFSMPQVNYRPGQEVPESIKVTTGERPTRTSLEREIE